MQHINYFFRILLIISVSFLPFLAFSQPYPTGYEIYFKPHHTNDKYIYLTGIYGNKQWIADSAKYAKKQYVFKNKKQVLPSGFYSIQLKDGTTLADFIIDQTRKFTIDATETELTFINSEENMIYQQFKKDLLEEKELDLYYETAPQSLLGKFVLAQYIPVYIPEFMWGSHEGKEAAAQQFYKYLANHYFDNVDFKDIRLMNTPLDIDLKDFFLRLLFPQTAENMIENIDNFFHRIVDEKPTQTQLDMQDFYLKKLIHIYMNADPKYDEVFIYMVDHYIANTTSDFISNSERSVYKRIADRKRKTLVGATIPVFESYTMDKHKISTADMKSKYTMLWFWDPDCEHCS